MSGSLLAAAEPHSQVEQRHCKVEPIGDEDAGLWDAYVQSRPEAAAYHRYGWRKVIRGVFDRETYYLGARGAHGELCGVLPLVRLKGLVVGDVLVSLPYFTYGGVVASHAAAQSGLVQAACDLGKRLGVDHIELRHRSNACPALPARTDKVSLLLDLPASAAELNKALPAKLRSQIKRPQREGVSAVNGGEELLEEFYRVFAVNMRDLGTPVYPRSFFAAVLREFPSETRVFVVRHAQGPVAAGLVLGHGSALEIPWASSLRNFNALGVNMLLYWSVLEYACGAGYRRFDFGRSTVDSGTFRFKRQWGAQPEQLHWHYWLRGGGAPPVLNSSNPKFKLAVSAWQRLPLSVANRIGPMLARNLP
ncbi:MAG TPA: FemAB family XrtA/PEP-CTERM system-associated protein [Steroidobacteraceae bacterium]|nr:FemAB family XrtA/PEP-CTERM system-associated protein [Steroidobacteraceae bacterium]